MDTFGDNISNSIEQKAGLFMNHDINEFFPVQQGECKKTHGKK